MSFLSEDRVCLRAEKDIAERRTRADRPYSATPSEIERQRRAEKNRTAHRIFPQLLKRYGDYLTQPVDGSRFKTSLSSQSCAFSQWLESTPANCSQRLPTWCAEEQTAHHPRSEAIEKAIRHFQTADEVSQPRRLAVIDLLLGPRLQEAKAKAADAFFNPQQHFYQTVREMVLWFIQNNIAQNKQKNADDAYEDLKICFQLYPLLETALSALIKTYQQAFPFVAEQFMALKAYFLQGELQWSLMELFDYVNQKLLFPGITLDTYTLEQFEQQSFFEERRRYEKALAQHLQQYPDDMALFLEAAQLSQDATVSCEDEERQTELIQHFSFLPAQMPWALSDYYLHQGHIPSSKLLAIFLAHGADMAHLSTVYPLFTADAWPILYQALQDYCSQSPLDTFIRAKLQTYCQEIHEKARWLSVVEALRDKKATPLAKRLLEACQHHEKYRGFPSQLLKAAREAQNHLQQPTLKPILFSFHSCFEKNEPLSDATSVSIDASVLWEIQLKQLLPGMTTLIVEASWFKAGNPGVAIQRLASYFPRFKHLVFANTGLTDDAFYALMTVWGYLDNPRKTIETLDLRHNLITDEGLKKIASRLSSWPTLHVLNLSGNLITSEGVETLLSALPKTTITTVHLGDTWAIDEALRTQLSEKLILNAQKSPALKVDLPTPSTSTSDNSLDEEEIADSVEADNQVDEAWAYMQTLTGFSSKSPDLHLSLATVGDIHLDKLVVYLQHRQAPLVSICFDGQSVKNLKDADFLRLIDALNRFPTLKTLSFKQTDMHVSSKVTLLQHYLSCPHLNVLDLRGNAFATTDIEFLTAFSKAQGSLQQIHVDTTFPLSPQMLALQTQLQENQQQHEALVAITTQLNTQKSPDTLIPRYLTLPTLRTLKYTPASAATKTWYHLLPVQGNTFLFDLSSKAFLRAEKQRRYFFKADANVCPLVRQSDKQYHDHFCGILYLLFTLAKEAKDDWSLGGAWSFPFEKIADVLYRLGSQANEVGLILYLADFLYQHYLYTGKAHRLTPDKALRDALTVLQWMYDNDTPDNPVVQLLIHQKLQVRHLSLLLLLCMGKTPIVMVVPTAQLSQYDAMIEGAMPPEAVFHNSLLPRLTVVTPLTDVVSFEDNALPQWDITFLEDMSAEETCENTWNPVLQKLYQRRYPETNLTLRALVPTGVLTSTHIEHLAKAILEGGIITKLNANGMTFTPETWKAFCALISHWSHLKELHVERALHEGALPILAPVLEKLPRLTTLNLSDNAGHITAEDRQIFFPHLVDCKQLQSLHLRHNGLTDEMLDLLWRNLPCLKRLAAIDLSSNQLTSYTVEQFMQQQSGVSVLILDHNHIEKTDINLLSEVLNERKLEKLDCDLREMVSKDAKDYASRNSKTNFLVRQFYHGSSTSMAHAKTLVQYEEEKYKEGKQTFYFLEKLKEHFLDESISSMSAFSLDTLLVSDIAALFEQAESPLLEGFYEQLQQLSTTDPVVIKRARKNTPFYVNTFPQLFSEQYQRCLERARLGLSIEHQLQEMDEEFKKMLKLLPRNEAEQKARQHEQALAAVRKATEVNSHSVSLLTSRVQTLEADVAMLKEQYHLLNSVVQAIQQIEREASDPVTVSSTTYQGLTQLMMNLRREQGSWLNTFATLEHQEQAALAEKLQTLQETVNRHDDILKHLIPSSVVKLSPEKAAYVTHFQQTVFQLYLASLMMSTGLFSYHGNGILSKTSKALNFLGNIIPFAGSGMKLLGSLLKTSDNILLERRMNRLRALGGFFEVMALSENLALQLFDINLPNPLSDGLLDTLLNMADSLTAAEGVWQVLEDQATECMHTLFAKPALTPIEERAEQDANLFLTRLCQEGRPHSHALYLTMASEASPRPETLVVYWKETNTLGCRLPNGQEIATLNEAGLGKYYASLSDKAQRNSQLITSAEEKIVNEIVAQDQWLPKVSRFTALLFYAIPLFVVADEIFKETLLLFCRAAGFEVDALGNKNNPYHRKEWCQSLTYVMNCYTSQLHEPISAPEKRQAFVKAVAKEYQESSMLSVSTLASHGLFYLKSDKNKPNASEKYVSMYPDRCTPEVAEAVLKRVFSK